MNYLITKHPEYFKKVIPTLLETGSIRFCDLDDMILPSKIALDTETTGLKPRDCDVFCVQIGTGKDNYIIHMYDDNYEFQDLVPYINGKILVGHNILFDLGFCYKYGFWPLEVRDTMLASKVLYNGDIMVMRHDFGSVMERELGIKYDKTEQKNIHLVKLSQPSTIEYSFNDVDRLMELEDKLCEQLDAGGFMDTYLLHCRYIRALAYMEQCGLAISPEKWKDKMIQDLKDQEKWRQVIEEYIFDNLRQFADRQIDMFDTKKRIHVSVTSPSQMIKVFKALGIPTKDKDGKDSIEENIISKFKHEFVKMWLGFQKANHRVTTFGDKIYSKIESNRIYTNFNPMVDTARLSTRRGEINFLNFPSDKATRECFVANEGNVMIVCDYSGQETVVAADLSGDKAMTESVVNGADLHSAFARVLFPELKELSDEIIMTQHKKERQAAKSPRFAFQYGGSAYTIHQNEGIPLDEAYEIENAFKLLHEGLYTWGEKEFKKAIKQGYIESADGWKLKLPKFDEYKKYEEAIANITFDQWKIYKAGKLEYKKLQEALEKKEKYEIHNKEAVDFYKARKQSVSTFFKLKSEYQRLCLNNPVQARSAMQLKTATLLLFNWIVEENYQGKVLIDNTIHDEIVVECPIEMAEQVRDRVEQCMLEGGNKYLTNLKIKADASIGESWYDAK